ALALAGWSGPSSGLWRPLAPSAGKPRCSRGPARRCLPAARRTALRRSGPWFPHSAGKRHPAGVSGWRIMSAWFLLRPCHVKRLEDEDVFLRHLVKPCKPARLAAVACAHVGFEQQQVIVGLGGAEL